MRKYIIISSIILAVIATIFIIGNVTVKEPIIKGFSKALFVLIIGSIIAAM